MYLQYFGLTQEPFHITPDPRFFYLSPSHKEAIAAFIYGIKNRKGFIAVIGEVGLGKTTVLRTFLEQQETRHKIKTVFVFNPNVTFKGLLKIIYAELGLQLPQTSSPKSQDDTSAPTQEAASDVIFDIVQNLHIEMMREFAQGTTVVLIIDEAQNMPIDTLENLRMLSNLESTTNKLLQIVLIGQPELEKTLNRQELRQLKQRIAIRSILRPLNKKQSLEYIRHRLKKAGLQGKIPFTRNALRLIYKYSRGTPRSINILCDNALVTGYGYGKRIIGGKIIREVSHDLQGKSFRGKKRFAPAIAVGLVLVCSALLFAAWQLNPDVFTTWRQSLQSETTKSAEQDSARNELGNEKRKLIHQPSPQALTNPENTPVAGEQLNQAVTPQPSPDQSRQVQAYPILKDPAPGSQIQTLESSPLDTKPLFADPQRRRISHQLSSLFPFYDQLSTTRQLVLIEMVKQTSFDGFLTFERMIDALYKQDYPEASRQMIISQWHNRMGTSASELARIMESDNPADLKEWISKYGS
jgi:general secretion pathway protein A